MMVFDQMRFVQTKSKDAGVPFPYDCFVNAKPLPMDYYKISDANSRPDTKGGNKLLCYTLLMIPAAPVIFVQTTYSATSKPATKKSTKGKAKGKGQSKSVWINCGPPLRLLFRPAGSPPPPPPDQQNKGRCSRGTGRRFAKVYA
jgi:hypothetical protein